MSVSTFADRVKDSYTGTPGTGNVTLTNSAPTGFRTFDSQFGHAGTHFYYVIDHGSEWEVGEGHLSAAATLVRDTVLSSSNAGALVNFTSGGNEVYADVPAGPIAAVLNGVKVYRASMSQSGLAAPVATVMENTLGAVVWTRNDVGDYRATLAGVFLAGKIFAQPFAFDAAGDGSFVVCVSFTRLSDNVLQMLVSCIQAAATVDDALTNIPIAILVYP